MITLVLKYEVKGFATALRMVIEVHEQKPHNYNLDRFRNSHPSDICLGDIILNFDRSRRSGGEKWNECSRKWYNPYFWEFEVKGLGTGLHMVIELHEHEPLSSLHKYNLDRFRKSYSSFCDINPNCDKVGEVKRNEINIPQNDIILMFQNLTLKDLALTCTWS